MKRIGVINKKRHKTLFIHFFHDKIISKTNDTKGKREAENNISVAPTTLLILFTQLPLLAKAFALLAYYPQKKFLIHVCNYILAIVYTFLKKKILKNKK